MHLAFRCSASPDDVRAFLAALISEGGTWRQTAHTPLPAEGHGDDPRLAHTEWVLGEATLTQVIAGGAGNPRDGYGFDLSIAAQLPGGRRASISGGNYDPAFNSLHFELHGFSVSQFARARELGRQRFTGDDTDHPVWARPNAKEVEALGDKAFARELLVEGLTRKAEDFARAAQRELRRHLIALTDDGAKRTLLEAEALEHDPSDVTTLAAIASGARTLPGWAPDRAARILAAMRPWAKESEALLAPASARWAGPQRTGWFWVNAQAYDVKVIDGTRTRVNHGPLLPAPLAMVVEEVRRALNIEGVHVQVGAIAPTLDEVRDGVLVGGQSVRGIAYRRDAALEWVWLWTGEDQRGAVVVATRSEPVETQLCWLGEPPPGFERFVLTPC